MVSERVKNNPVLSIDFLKPGDLIDVVSPGSACSESSLENAVKWIEQNGFRARADKKMLDPKLYLSNTDAYRFEHLASALKAQDSKAIWCMRGGYGSSRLIPNLLKLKPVSPKLFIGLSDITTLHLFLNTKWGWPTLHASLLDRLADSALTQENEQELLLAITGQKKEFIFDGLTALNQTAQEFLKNNSTISGSLTGGNLTVVCSQVGTQNAQLIRDNILFFEDRGERGYRIDRMLEQIRQSSMLENTKAIVLGEFTEGNEANGLNHVWAAWNDFASRTKIPVFSGVPCGHGLIQRPLFFSTRAEIFKTSINDAIPGLRVYNSWL